METLIKTERCKDGTLARYIRDAHGIVYVEFVQNSCKKVA